MSLLDDNFISIPLYYMIKVGKYDSKQIVVIDDDKASKMLEDEDIKGSVQILNTKWKVLSWKENNDLMKACEVISQSGETPIFDWAKFADLRLKRALKWWDLKNNEEDPEPAPLNAENIDRLPSVVAQSLLDRYAQSSSVDEDELGK